MPVSADKKLLKDNCPAIVIGTPGRMLALSTKQDKPLDLSKVKYFVLDECDQMLKAIGKPLPRHFCPRMHSTIQPSNNLHHRYVLDLWQTCGGMCRPYSWRLPMTNKL